MTRSASLGTGSISVSPLAVLVHFGSPPGTEYSRPCDSCGSREHSTCDRSETR